MPQVVINQCYGGFGLSPAAEAAWESRTDREFDSWNVPRHDPDLIAVVKLFGKEANGDCAELNVVTITGNQYLITEYDGSEGIRTPENTKWITIEPQPIPDKGTS
jgi:hypothetical protein